MHLRMSAMHSRRKERWNWRDTYGVRNGPVATPFSRVGGRLQGSRDHEVDPGVGGHILGDDDVIWVPRRVLQVEDRGIRKVQPDRVITKGPPVEVVAFGWCRISFDGKTTWRQHD